jgi:acyl carrier protein phosphodiesterase
MNYLAHIYLSGESEKIQLGNFIGDYVKGNQFNNYPAEIRKGILLHRKIDHFTDKHPIVKQCIEQVRPGFGKHAGIVTDIFFDHFLASKWEKYSQVQLRHFTKRFHTVLLLNYSMLPLRVKLFLPFIIQHKRLQSYAELSGIERSLQIMGQRTSLPENSYFAMELLTSEYDFFLSVFFLN